MDLRTAVIKKCQKKDQDDRPASEQRWCLYSSDGKKLLGRHPSKEKALKQERAIQVRKHGSAPQVLFRGAVYQLVESERIMDPNAEKRSAFNELETILFDLRMAIDTMPRVETPPGAAIIDLAEQRKFRQGLDRVLRQLRWVSWRCRWQSSR